MKTLYYSHPDFLAHDTGPGHPECADRLVTIENLLAEDKFNGLSRTRPSVAKDIDKKLALIHTPSMIRQVLDKIPAHGLAYLDADTVVSPGSRQAALLAVSAICDAVDKVLGNEANNAFCALRPPGHHAEPTRSMGFCLFNNIAIAAEHARVAHKLDKIAIVDFDVHHGNGTQMAFYRQPQVFYASSHQWPHYPGSGAISETGVGNIVNVPLPAGTSGAEFREKYRTIVFPALRAFKPKLLLISAGFDAHKDDPLASLQLVEADYQWLTRQLMTIADECCDGRIVSTLEGGYNLNALAASVAVHVACLNKID
ncbi:MAG: histone deacetylase family protein [Methylomonas sp.]